MKLLMLVMLVVAIQNLPTSVFSQSAKPLFIVSSEGRSGYADRSGKVIIARSFQSARDFSEGLAPVRINDKWGFIDEKGTIRIRPSFEEAYPFSEGRAAIKVGDRWGFISRSGSIVISPQFTCVSGFQGRSGEN